jgi:hypothetical protein
MSALGLFPARKAAGALGRQIEWAEELLCRIKSSLLGTGLWFAIAFVVTCGSPQSWRRLL